MINQTKVSFVLIILTIAAKVTESEFSDTDDAKITRLLKKLNKPALKSIKVNQIRGLYENNKTYLLSFVSSFLEAFNVLQSLCRVQMEIL